MGGLLVIEFVVMMLHLLRHIFIFCINRLPFYICNNLWCWALQYKTIRINQKEIVCSKLYRISDICWRYEPFFINHYKINVFRSNSAYAISNKHCYYQHNGCHSSQKVSGTDSIKVRDSPKSCSAQKIGFVQYYYLWFPRSKYIDCNEMVPSQISITWGEEN